MGEGGQIAITHPLPTFFTEVKTGATRGRRQSRYCGCKLTLTSWFCGKETLGVKEEAQNKKVTSEQPLVIKVQHWYRYVLLALAIVAMGAIALMSFSTSADIIKRWIMIWPFPGVHQLNETLMVVMVFLGIGWSQLHRRHIRVSFIISRMSDRRTVIMDIIACLFCLVCIFFLGWKTLQEGLYSVSILEFSGMGNVRFPVYWARMLIPLGALIFAGQLIIDIWTNFTRLRGKLPLEIADIRRA